MQFATIFVAASALVAGASAHYGGNASVVYTTDVVTAYTTYCPEATQVSFNGKTYTVTEASTLTISECPCTIVRPVTTYSSVYCNTCQTASSAPSPPPVYANSTAPVPVAPTSTPVAVGTGGGVAPSATPSTLPVTGSGNRAMAASGAGLAALLGIAAYIL